MAKDNSKFFDKKQEWSKIKDDLLLSYLPAYFQKILFTRRPVFYVDCFAGMGVFKDGQPGSPVIALDIRREALAKTRAPDARIDMCFIDKNYEAELRQNTSAYPEFDSHGRKTIIGGKYEEQILELLKVDIMCSSTSTHMASRRWITVCLCNRSHFSRRALRCSST